jgi:transposase-like protein
MSEQTKAPETLLEAVKYFDDEDVATQFVASLRWPDGEQVCPRCGVIDEHYFLKTRRIWKCKACKKQFSIKLGTIFEDSPIPLSKWLPAMWMLANCRNGISSYELARAIGVTQKTAWFMLHRIRLAMQSESFERMDGEVEVDETYIGGKARNMHYAKRKRVVKGTGGMSKVAVMGLLARHGPGSSKVRANVIPDTTSDTFKGSVRHNVEQGATLYTDAHRSYHGLDAEYIHGVIDHAESYAKGAVHTNGLENFWSLLKRSVAGTYVSVEPFHLFRYLDEHVFRFNNREESDLKRFLRTASAIIDKRLTYAALTGAGVSET